MNQVPAGDWNRSTAERMAKLNVEQGNDDRLRNWMDHQFAFLRIASEDINIQRRVHLQIPDPVNVSSMQKCFLYFRLTSLPLH